MGDTWTDLDIKATFSDYWNVFLESKKYWLIYLAFISIATLSTLTRDNITSPKFEIIIFALMAIIGIFCILFYFLHNSDEELYKVAFVVILSFGIICALLVPVVFHVDELEHLTRSELTSHGEFIPHWTGDDIGIHRLYNLTEGESSDEFNAGAGFYSIESMKFFEDNWKETVFTTDYDTDKINHTPYIRPSSFEQNPFYGYLPQGIGIFIAKLLDLNVIWMLWLGRIFNLVCFAFLIAVAIRIAPCLKMPLIVISCIPVAIYHAASVSIDSMIFGLGILAVAYFLHLHQSSENSIDNKHLAVFTLLCLLLGLCKLPYLAFIFLLLLVPRDNFKNNNVLPLIILGVLLVGICGILWSRYSVPALMHSWRSSLNHVNSTQQLNYLLNDPTNILKFIQHSIMDGLFGIPVELFNFDYGNENSFARFYYIIMAVEAYLAIVLFAYPRKVKFDLKTRLGCLSIFLIIYFGSYFIQLLTWSNVGQMNFGVHMRYFIPLLCLVPIFFQLNPLSDENRRFDKYAFVFMIGFMATFILALAIRFY